MGSTPAEQGAFCVTNCAVKRHLLQMARHIILTWCTAVLFGICAASADTGAVLLSDLTEEAKANNPEILAAQHRYEAAEARVTGVRYLTDPMIAVEFAPSMRMYSITQTMPFPTKLSTLSSIAGTEADEYRQLYEMTTLDVVTRIKKTYAELYYIHKEIQAIDESIGFLKQFFNIASQHYALGHAPQTDVLRAQIELAKVENQRLTAKDRKEVIEAQFNTMLNRDAEAPVGTPQPVDTNAVTYEIEELYERARDYHPQLAATRHMVERAEFMKSFARQHYLPDFMFRFTQVEQDGAFTDQKYMFGLTVPLWFFGKQNNMVSEATAQVEMLRAYYQNMENSVLLDVKAAKVETDRSARTRVLYEHSIIPQAYANVKSALVAYEANEIDFMTLLESERILLQFQLEQYRAQTDFFKSIAELEEAIGGAIVLD